MVNLTQYGLGQSRKKHLAFGGSLEAKISDLLLVCSFLSTVLWLAAACISNYLFGWVKFDQFRTLKWSLQKSWRNIYVRDQCG